MIQPAVYAEPVIEFVALKDELGIHGFDLPGPISQLHQTLIHHLELRLIAIFSPVQIRNHDRILLWCVRH